MLFYLVCLVNVLLISSISGIKPVVSLYASSLGASPAEISIIVAGFGLLPAFLALQIGRWTDKYGNRTMILIGSSLFIIALLISAVFPNFAVLVLQQLIVGTAFTIVMISLQRSLGSMQGDIDRMVANFSLFGSIGQMTGPIVCTPVYEHFGFQAVCVLNTAMLLVALTVGFLVKKETWEGSAPLPPEHGGETEIKRSVWSLLSERNLRNAIITSGLVLSNRELFSAYFPLLAAQLGISPSMIGVLLAINGFTMLLVRFGQSALVRLFGRMNVLTWSLYISGLIYLVMPLSPWLIVMAVLVGILGAGLGLGQPLSMAYAIEVSPPDRKGEVLGLRITLNRSSQVSIPLIFGGLGGLAGASAVFLASGAVLALFGYLTRPLPSDRQKAEKKGMGM